MDFTDFIDRFYRFIEFIEIYRGKDYQDYRDYRDLSCARIIILFLFLNGGKIWLIACSFYIVKCYFKMGDSKAMLMNEIDDQPTYSISTVAYPWRRYFARNLDLTVYSILWLIFSHLVLRWNPKESLPVSLLDTFIIIGLMLMIEPVLLSLCGTTLGKWVFGLVIRDKNGKKLTRKQAFQRTFGVFTNGYGFNIPIYNIVRQEKCYNACSSQEPMTWEEGFTYTIKDTKIVRALVFIGLTILMIATSYLVLLQAQMPIHRGNITTEKYYENCNYIMSYSNLYEGQELNAQGEWVDNTPAGTYYINMSSQPLPKHELTVKDGFVQAVKIEVELNTNEWISGYSVQKYIAFMSFLAAQKETNAIRIQYSGRLQTLNNNFADYSFVEAGVRVTNKVEYSGYSKIDDNLLIPSEGMEQYFHMIFTLEKVTS